MIYVCFYATYSVNPKLVGANDRSKQHSHRLLVGKPWRRWNWTDVT